MPEDDLIDIKFRLYDGSDIGPFRYSSASTIDVLKQRIVSDWPKGSHFTLHLFPNFSVISTQFVIVSDIRLFLCLFFIIANAYVNFQRSYCMFYSLSIPLFFNTIVC